MNRRTISKEKFIENVELHPMRQQEDTDIAIVGGGICGLATALALHRKGINALVFEKSETTRAVGSAITIFTNGWRALDQLGVASKLRSTAIPITGSEELRCLKRSVLIETLVQELPASISYFGCQVVTIKSDPLTAFPILHFRDGNSIKAKFVIGCDGANSVVSKFLGLKPAQYLSSCSILGFTNYPHGHGLESESIRMRRGSISVGRIPVDDKVVYWFVGRKWTPQDSDISKDPEMIRESALESTGNFPEEVVEMIRKCDIGSLILTRLKYHAPWDILFGRFTTGTVTVAGDAMHLWAPFLGQGASAAIEDAIVLARCLAQHLTRNKVQAPLQTYVKQRRMRLVKLSTQTYLTGMLLEPSSVIVHYLCLMLLMVFFHDMLGHTRYNCGPL
ncbi:monooxygenase 1 isoform X3 [Neltuma alba]|uniref:monooxygenase 1 isoform X3 n=1 Tax=Neltuma alba TaxID=207710 RepID=UPI0010A54970|nr:monooxygenase 1-like isoform X3 [Prosopis alba]